MGVRTHVVRKDKRENDGRTQRSTLTPTTSNGTKYKNLRLSHLLHLERSSS